MFPSKKSHIPLIIKKPYQKAKKDISEPAYAEQVLREVIM